MKAPDYLRKSRRRGHNRRRQPAGIFPWLAVMISLLAACSLPGMAVAPVATSTIAAPPGPTFMPAPAATAACFTEPDTAAALLTGQAKLAAALPGATVIWYDGFGCGALGDGWTVGRVNPTLQVSLVENFLTVRTQKVAQVWDSVGRSTATLVAEQGILLLFQYEAGTTAPLFIHLGDWQTQNYLRAGLAINNEFENAWQIWEGFAFLSFPMITSVLRPDAFFYLMIRLSNDGQVTMRVWERDNPNNYGDYQDRMPGIWVGRRWAFQFQILEGAIKIDDYFEFSLPDP